MKKTASLLVVLLLAKVLIVSRFDLPISIWLLPALIWQDLIVVMLFSLVEWAGRRRPAIGWGVYVLIILYVGFNVPVARLFSTPLTWPMLRATSGTIGDSISHQVTTTNLFFFIGVVCAGLSVPTIFDCCFTRRLDRVVWKRSRRFSVAVIIVVLLIVAIGPTAAARTELLAAHGNAVYLLVTSALPRVDAQEAHSDWSVSPFGREQKESLEKLQGRAAGRNVVIIHLESTGAKYLRPYGAEEDPMPNLTKLSSRAILFENAYSAYPETIKSFFAVHCSFYPSLDADSEVYEHVASPSLATQLVKNGYQTGLFHSGRFMYLGMDSVIHNRGFETLEDAGDIGGNKRSSFGIDEPATVERMLRWLDSLERDRPFFLTYLPIAGHHPYETIADGPFPEDREIDRYRNALHEADAALGQLLSGLQQRGLYESTLFVVFGDHGEAFDQHQGNFGHTMFLYEENVRIPYLVFAPGLINESIRIKRNAGQVDTAPTVLDLLGLGQPTVYQGRSLLQPTTGMALFCTDYSRGLVGLRDERWKFIYELDSGRSKLFDMDTDPVEQFDLSPRFAERVNSYRRHLLRWCAAQKFAVQEAAENGRESEVRRRNDEG